MAVAIFVGVLLAALTVSYWSSSEASDPGAPPAVAGADAAAGGSDAAAGAPGAASGAPDAGAGAPLAIPIPLPNIVIAPLPEITPETLSAVRTLVPAPKPERPAPEVARALPSAVGERLPAGRREFDVLVRAQVASASETPLREHFTVAGAPAVGGKASRAADEEFEIEYTFDPELSAWVFTLLGSARVDLGHVLVADARSGRMLTYASTNPRRFPPTRLYPAASLVKVVTAAAALPRSPNLGQRDCVYAGSPYRLTPARIDPPRRGRPITFARALAQSNNQCFAQLAVHQLGSATLLRSIRNFGWLSSPAAGHPAGLATAGSSRYDLGMLGSGLSGTQITPLHALQMALTLSDGTVRHPYWIERVLDDRGEMVPSRMRVDAGEPRALSARDAVTLRGLMVETTVRGTARRAFRMRNGRPLLGAIKVAAKTGSLSGTNPPGHYDWFAAVAPADDPRVAITVLTIRGRKWYQSSSQLGAQVLKQIFCPRGRCSAEAADDWLDVPAHADPPAPPEDATGQSVEPVRAPPPG